MIDTRKINIKNNFRYTLVLLTSFLLLSCSSIDLDEESPNENIGVAPIEDVKNNEPSTKNNPSKKSKILEKPITPIEYENKQQIDKKMAIYKSFEPSIYFDYDDFIIKQQYQELIRVTYELMQLNTQYTLLVEGHSDERGTTEYNLALGQKRAESVVRAVEQLGISRDRIDAISFGEEKPLAIGSNSVAWGKNRRADLTLK